MSSCYGKYGLLEGGPLQGKQKTVNIQLTLCHTIKNISPKRRLDFIQNVFYYLLSTKNI